MIREGASAQEEEMLAALRDIQALSRLPLPTFTKPPWAKVRAALPPGITLPEQPVHVLVDLDIDATGTVVHAAVGHVPPSLAALPPVAACGSPDGEVTIQPPLESADAALAQAVAAGFMGAKFTPGERDGRPVAVRQFRMGIEVRPEVLRSGPAH